MNKPLLEKMGGERVCRVCGYIEREVYRLFCPRCMQRDCLSALTILEDYPPAGSYTLEPPEVKPGRSVSM
jgi:transposase